LNVTDGRELLIADPTLEFVAKCERLLRDDCLGNAVRQNAFQWVEANHGPSAMIPGLKQIYALP